MFTCFIHSWYSLTDQCPQCSRPVETSDSTEFIINPTSERVTADPKDEEIARLKEDVKELVEGLDSYPGFGSFSYNPAEAVAWVQKIDALIQKHKQ